VTLSNINPLNPIITPVDPFLLTEPYELCAFKEEIELRGKNSIVGYQVDDEMTKMTVRVEDLMSFSKDSKMDCLPEIERFFVITKNSGSKKFDMARIAGFKGL